MPFRPDMVFNWTKHNFVHGVCQRCTLMVPHDVMGELWSSEGAIVTGEPVGTNWTVCKAA